MNNDKVLILEFKTQNKWPQKVISFFTRNKYCHTAMVIGEWYCELNQKGYNVKKLKGIERYTSNNYVDVFEVKRFFSEKELCNGLEWWQQKHDLHIHYGYRKLPLMPISINITPFYRWMYRTTGKPYSPIFDFKHENICTVAVDVCLKQVMNYDCFPKLSERVTWPGCFAVRLHKWKVK